MQISKNLLICSLWILPGCLMVGPQYRKPCRPISTSYAHAQHSSPCADLAQWWTFFNDPCLNSLISKAIARNYDLKVALDKIDEMRAQYEISKSKLWPEIDAFAVALRTQLSQQNCMPLQSNQTTSSSLFNLSSYLEGGIFTYWEIDLWGRTRHARDAAYAQLEAQVESMRDVYIMLLSNVATAYISIRALEKKIALQEERVKIDTALLGLTKDRLNAGLASDIPNQQEIQELQDTISTLITLKTTLEQTKNGLAVLLSENPQEFKLCTGAAEVPLSHKKIEVGLPSELLQRRPDIRQTERLLAAATENIGVAVADYFPRFSLLGAVGEATSRASHMTIPGSLSWSILPFVNWPLITYGRLKFTVDAKKAAERHAFHLCPNNH